MLDRQEAAALNPASSSSDIISCDEIPSEYIEDFVQVPEQPPLYQFDESNGEFVTVDTIDEEEDYYFFD